MQFPPEFLAEQKDQEDGSNDTDRAEKFFQTGQQSLLAYCIVELPEGNIRSPFFYLVHVLA